MDSIVSDFELLDKAASLQGSSTLDSSCSINQWEIFSPSQQFSTSEAGAVSPTAPVVNSYAKQAKREPKTGAKIHDQITADNSLDNTIPPIFTLSPEPSCKGCDTPAQSSTNCEGQVSIPSMVKVKYSDVVASPKVSATGRLPMEKDSAAAECRNDVKQSSGVLVEKESCESGLSSLPFCGKMALSSEISQNAVRVDKEKPVTCTMSSLPVTSLRARLAPCFSAQSAGARMQEKVVDLANAYKLQDLFRGRFTISEAQFLLKKFNGNLQQTANFVFETEPKTLRDHLQEDPDKWEMVKRQTSQAISSSCSVVPHIPTTTPRLYACGRCDKYWWADALTRKPGCSKCRHCHTKYEPVPTDKEWGWAEFKCPQCDIQFHGWCQMSFTSPCLKCGMLVSPTCIKPPLDRTKKRTLDWRQHRCATCLGPNCAHPWTRLRKNLPKVLTPSQPHDVSNTNSSDAMSKVWSRDAMMFSECSALSSIQDNPNLDPTAPPFVPSRL